MFSSFSLALSVSIVFGFSQSLAPFFLLLLVFLLLAFFLPSSHLLGFKLLLSYKILLSPAECFADYGVSVGKLSFTCSCIVCDRPVHDVCEAGKSLVPTEIADLFL